MERRILALKRLGRTRAVPAICQRWKRRADFHYDRARKVDLVIGAALAVRRTLFDAIGMFDERFFLYHEEVDFTKRAAELRWETWFVPASEAVHEGMGSAK